MIKKRAGELNRKMHFNGDADALYEIGCAYEDADGVEHDSVAAAVCFRTAAEQGHADAQCILGRRVGCAFFDDESFLPLNLDRGCCGPCRMKMAAAIEGGGILFEACIGEEVDKVAARECWLKTAEQGCYSCRRNAAAAMWYSKAAAQGHAEAQFEIGACYFNGDGVTVDKVAAMEWWLKAAENGNATAQFNVGIHYSAKAYQAGPGECRESLSAAGSAWFRKAAKQGHPGARDLLGMSKPRPEPCLPWLHGVWRRPERKKTPRFLNG